MQPAETRARKHGSTLAVDLGVQCDPQGRAGSVGGGVDQEPHQDVHAGHELPESMLAIQAE